MEAMIGPLHDYHVFTSRRGDYPERWSWEIRRKSKPLGVKLAADGFQFDVAAQFAGTRALGGVFVRIIEGRKTPTEVEVASAGA